MATERLDKGRTTNTPFERPGSDIKKMGYLKKLKTNKKKYFLLRSTSSSGPARLEYYDSEKKFRHGQLPKRSIQLHTLLNINKKWDSKHKYAIALYTKDDCFSVMAEDETDQELWYSLLLDYQCEYLREDENRREHFEHVWQVTIQQKGLGVDKKLRGNFRLCLSRNSLSLVRVNSEKPQVSFQLATVRSLAHNDNLFRMEVGSWAPTGAGELWMHVEDSVIAQSMHEAILNCMKASTSTGSFDEPDVSRFDRRTDSIHTPYRIRPLSQDFRPRTVSESHTQSPRRLRPKPSEEQQRPVSIVYPSRSTSLSTESASPGTSPHMHLELFHGHRLRTDSWESQTSRSSMHAQPTDDLSPMEFPISGFYSDYTTQAINEEEDYMEQDIGPNDFSSISSSPGEAKTPIDEESGHASPYMDMRPTNTTPPMVRSDGSSTGGGYVSMNLGSQTSSQDGSVASEGDPYMLMNTGRVSSEPIPIKPPGSGGGYMDMSHSSHLPTVREGGSNEGYLPMTPNSGQSPMNTSHLRPDPAVCMLADDQSDFHKRTYSLGSRPTTKTSSSRIPNIHDPVPIKRGIMDNDGRSCSAPHLITNRGRSLNVESPTPSASPLSMSFKSESSYRSDDSDSFMEIDFHRPRTASDSYSSRPRASSFGKTAMQALQGHRPRSSSYGQGVRTFKLKHGARIASHESVRTTSQELLHKSSIDSLSHRSSRDSLRVSSSESLRKLSEELRTKTNLLNTDYIDMSMDKRKMQPSQQPSRGQENGYMDMTLSSRTTSPSRSKSSHDSGNTSKSQSSEMLHVQGHLEQTYINVDSPDTTTSSSSATLVDHTDQHQHRHAGAAQPSSRPESRGSEKHPRSSTEDMYVMYEPSSKSSGSAHPQEDCQSLVSMRKGSGSTDSLKKKSRHSMSSEKSKKDHRSRSGSSSSKRKSHLEDAKEVQVTKVIQSASGKTESGGPTDEYVEFAPAGKSSVSSTNQSSFKSDKHRKSPVIEESEYVGYQPGSTSASSAVSKPLAVKSFFSSKPKHEKEPSGTASDKSRVTHESGLKSSSSNMSKPKKHSEESDYVLSSLVQGQGTPGAGGDSASKFTPASSLPRAGGSVVGGSVVADSGDASEYVQSSPIRKSTPVSSKGAGKESDYVLASPCKQPQTCNPDTQKQQSAASPAASQNKTTKKVPTSDNAYFNLDLSKTSSCHEGSSVDPLPQSNTGKSPTLCAQEDKRPVQKISLDASVGIVQKPQSKSESVNSPAGKRRDKKSGRTKHISGNAGSGSSEIPRAGFAGQGDTCREGSRLLKEPNSASMIRPGSTPCMLSLDESQVKPAAAAATTLKVESNARGRHSISDLSAYEQMTFPSNTLSTSQQHSSGNMLSTSQQVTTSDSEKVLNYASLDLGSSETMGEGDSSVRSPRTKSRHSSATEDKGEPPLSYAQIDFEKSENLKSASGNRDVKFTL